MPIRLVILGLFLAVTSAPAAWAQPSGPQPWWPVQPSGLPFLHSLFTNDMVLQRDIAAPIWGWSEPGDTIAVAFDGHAAGETATAGSDGRWMTKIGPFPAGGPHTIVVAGRNRQVTLTGVLCGDVWLCSGQSNMNWPVRLSQNGEEEARQADQPRIRSFTVGFYPSLVPLKVPPPARWEVCKPEFARNFTAIGYFFAREISQTQNIPIGIIHSSVGATYAETWVSAQALHRQMPYDSWPADLVDSEELAGPNAENFDYFAEIEKWTAQVDPASAAQNYARNPQLDSSDWRDMEVPKPWEEAGLPEFDGLVWFRHQVDVPDEWAGRDLLLQLSTINDTDVTWFNGALVGAKQLKGIRSYVLDGKLVKAGKNLLAVAVLNTSGPGGFCSSPPQMLLGPASGGKNVRLAGTWKAKQSVALKDITLPFPAPKLSHYKTKSGMYNGMISPLLPFAIKGALWYQGEANGPRWLQYRRLLPTLIGDWRDRFQVGDFPFLIVSLANYNPLQTRPVEPGWAEIRESQWRTVRRVANTGLAVTIDIGDAKDIHPRNKQEAGRRLALVARNLVYGEKDLVCSGPEFTEMQIEPPKGDRIRLYFKHLGGGLMIKPGDEKLTGFAVAGPDRNFVWADAVIEGETIVVSSPAVPDPKYVRYGWAWNPLVNLYNEAGLPALTFRTDE